MLTRIGRYGSTCRPIRMHVPSDADARIVRYEPTMMVPALPVMSDAPPMASPTTLARERDTAEDDISTIESLPIILKGKATLPVSQCSCRAYTKSPPMGSEGNISFSCRQPYLRTLSGDMPNFLQIPITPSLKRDSASSFVMFSSFFNSIISFLSFSTSMLNCSVSLLAVSSSCLFNNSFMDVVFIS